VSARGRAAEVAPASVITLPAGHPEGDRAARCAACGATFRPRRRDHRWCSSRCRVRGFAAERLATLRAIRDALDAPRPDVAALRNYVEGEIARWEATRDGRPRPRRKATRTPGLMREQDARS
jgi:hypothetical protein